MKVHSIYRPNVVSGNVYALSARDCGLHSSSIKKTILNWRDWLLNIPSHIMVYVVMQFVALLTACGTGWRIVALPCGNPLCQLLLHCLKKNLNASRPSERPLVRGVNI